MASRNGGHFCSILKDIREFENLGVPKDTNRFIFNDFKINILTK